MLDVDSNFWSVVVLLATIGFFGAVSLLYFTAQPYAKRDWARVTVAITSAVLCVAAVVALF